MKKIYLFLLFIILSSGISAQCMASMQIEANGNVVTVTITGSGAVEPGYGITWGDDSEDMSQTATHIYDSPGTYTICFVYYDLTNIIGCNQSACEDVIITGGGCSMDFTPNDIGLSVQVNVLASGASAPSYTIDWGDGSAIDYTDQAAHTYASPGTYTICATYTDLDDPDNCTLYQCHDITVEEQSGNCTVELSVNVDGSTVEATAVGNGAASDNFLISWGDGGYDNEANAIHSYTTTGPFTVCVAYGDFGPKGCSATDCEDIVIEEVSGECTFDMTLNISGLTVLATAQSSGATTPEYSIDWGDGSPAETSFPASHTYASEGTYQVCASYVDLDNLENCQLVECETITVAESTTTCTADINVVVTGATVTATAVGDGAANPQFAITWGDGSFPTLSNSGSHTYTASNSYQVCVTYIDLAAPTECSVTDCETVDIIIDDVENIISVNSITIAPNPLADESIIRLQLNQPSHIEIQVVDLTGKLVQTVLNGERGMGIQSIPFNAESLSRGIYFLRVIASGEEKVVKMIR